MPEAFRYKHVGDRPLRLAETDTVPILPGEEIDRADPIVSNGNFEPVSDNAKDHQAQVDAEDAERLKEHLLRIGGSSSADEPAETVSDPPAKRSRKSGPAADAAAPQEA